MENNQVSNWIIEGLAFQRGVFPLKESHIENVKKWASSISKISPKIPPLGIISDIGHILTKDTKEEKVEFSDPSISKIALAYEEQFLGRILSDFRLERCIDIIREMDPTLRDVAIATFIDQILERLKISFDSPSSSLLLRNLGSKNNQIILEELNKVSSYELVRDDFSKLVQTSRNSGFLVSNAEIHILENIEVLSTKSQRLAITMVSDAGNALSRHFPKQARMVRDRGEVSTNVQDDSAYPIGGYAGMSTKGSIESVVNSELIYMDPKEKIDLFSLRFVSGELLKYTRDESVHRREKRKLVLLCEESLVKTKKKDKHLPYQRIIMVLGGILAGVNNFVKWMSNSDLDIIIYFPKSLDSEKKLMELLLSEFIRLELVQIKTFEKESFSEESIQTEKPSLVDILYIREESAPLIPSDDFLEYELLVCKEPSLQTLKKTVSFGSSFTDWALLFSQTFQMMV